MQWIELIINLGLPMLLLMLGYGVGRGIEKRHYASIRAREREFETVVALNTRYIPDGVEAQGASVVSGSVVVSSDYFKTFVAGFRNLVGGRFRGYEALLERARREALLRMKAQAREAGCSLVIGVRFQTTRVSGAQIPAMEVIAYGTAVQTLA